MDHSDQEPAVLLSNEIHGQLAIHRILPENLAWPLESREFCFGSGDT